MEKNQEKQQYYDSDIASVNEQDFLSDNQPPKEIEGERRAIKKDKFKRVYKSIYRLGCHIDKPAPFDRVTLRYQRFQTKPQSFPREGTFLTYNLGLEKDHCEIQQYVSTMSSGEASLFEIQILKMCDKTNIKVLDYTFYYVIDLKEYTTVIDLDNDRVFMKQIQAKGEGHFRVSQCDEVVWEYSISCGEVLEQQQYDKAIIITNKLIWDMPRSVWRLLQTMKANQKSLLYFDHETFQKVQGTQFAQSIIKQNKSDKIKVWVHVKTFVKVDDIFFTQQLLKKTVRKGNSTNKASDGSIVYYCVGFFAQDGSLVKEDKNFQLDVDDLQQLQKIDCRTHYLDQFRCSQMLKNILTRVKPLEIAQFTCYDQKLINYGWDYQELMELFKEIPPIVHMKIKMFNFTEQKTAYNTTVKEKIFHCQRKKSFGIKFIEKSQFKNAKAVFDYMISLFDSGVQTEQDKKQIESIKLSALMNSSLCALKMNDYQQVVDLCKKAKQLKNSEKCTYRLALAYKKKGQAQQGLDQLSGWSKQSPLNQQMIALKGQLQSDLQKYNKKSKTIYSNMFN